MIPKIYKVEYSESDVFIINFFSYYFFNIPGIKGLPLQKISQIYFVLNLGFFSIIGCTSLFHSKRALDKGSFITKSQALIHGNSLLIFFLHLIASQVTRRMKKATVHIFSPLHMSIIL